MTTYTFQDIEDALTYPFEDADWVNKLLILGAVGLSSFVIPLVGVVFIQGYMAQIARQAALEGGLPKLPPWTDWRKIFADGIRVLGVQLVYGAPVILVFLTAFGAMFGPVFISLLAGEAEGASPGLFEGLLVVGMLVFFGLFALAFFYSLVLGLFLPLPLMRAIVEQRFAAGFELRAAWVLAKANLQGLLITWALTMALGIGLAVGVQLLAFTIVLAPLAGIALSAYTPLVTAYLYAHLYRDSLVLSGQPALS